MKHTKKALRNSAIICFSAFVMFAGVGIFRSIVEESWVLGVCFYIFALIFLVCGIINLVSLIRENYIEEDVIIDIYRREVARRRTTILQYFNKEEISKMAKGKVIPVFAEDLDFIYKYIDDLEAKLKEMKSE